MPTLKVQGTIDEAGKLILHQPLNLSKGEVEVIIIQKPSSEVSFTPNSSRIKSLKELLETAPPIVSEIDIEEARWEALKGKYNL